MPGGVISTGAHPKLLWPGIHAIWGQTYNQHPTEYTELFDMLTSEQAYEQDVKVTGFGLAPVKPEGAPQTFDSEVQGQVSTYPHIAYSLGYIVTFEELRDNLYEIVSRRRAKANAFSIAQTLENLGAGLYNDAFTGNVFLNADGQAIISTAHTNATGGTFSNAMSPAADLSEGALEDMSIQIWGAQNDRGLAISIMPMSLHIAKQEFYNANRILKSVLQSGTSNNDINVLKATNAFPGGIKMNHYFSAPHAWFVRTNCPNGMQAFWRDRPMFDTDNEFDTKNAKAAAYFRISFGQTDPLSIFGSNGA
jgi:hypothetical protein